MNTESISMLTSARASAQGYVRPDVKPACKNCFACNPRSASCSYGSFAVDSDGWCPLWVPTVEWGSSNPASLSQMGLSMGDNLKSPDHGLQREGA